VNDGEGYTCLSHPACSGDAYTGCPFKGKKGSDVADKTLAAIKNSGSRRHILPGEGLWCIMRLAGFSDGFFDSIELVGHGGITRLDFLEEAQLVRNLHNVTRSNSETTEGEINTH
jgi:hypothetical protein